VISTVCTYVLGALPDDSEGASRRDMLRLQAVEPPPHQICEDRAARRGGGGGRRRRDHFLRRWMTCHPSHRASLCTGGGLGHGGRGVQQASAMKPPQAASRGGGGQGRAGQPMLPLMTWERPGEEPEPKATMGALPLCFTTSVKELTDDALQPPRGPEDRPLEEDGLKSR
jgi:hypothetical protein